MAPLATIQSQMSSLAENQPFEISLGLAKECVHNARSWPAATTAHQAFPFGIAGCVHFPLNLSWIPDAVDRVWVDLILLDQQITSLLACGLVSPMHIRAWPLDDVPPHALLGFSNTAA